jgi:hypothetical protein
MIHHSSKKLKNLYSYIILLGQLTGLSSDQKNVQEPVAGAQKIKGEKETRLMEQILTGSTLMIWFISLITSFKTWNIRWNKILGRKRVIAKGRKKKRDGKVDE